ncbi:hypothetical protein P8605_21825, partial [Streptomyces sp. T-3]|nr:hypothetical protein [Streptomyces sp. T-3]
MKLPSAPARPRLRDPRMIAAAVLLVVAGLLAVNAFVKTGPDRPDRPGGGLAGQLEALRGENDLVRGSATD